jgi:pimeloyl-ACP methyl ester carboxylesterase
MVVVPLAACWLWSCVTLDGAVFGIAAMALGIAPVLWNRGQARETSWLRRSAVACLSLWLVMTCWLAWRQPNGQSRNGSRVCNRYVGGGWNYDTMALGALLPEVDQFMLGFKWMPALDPLFTTQQAATLSALTRTIYAELEADPDFHALGSVMPNAYQELWGRHFDNGHYFLYVPPQLDQAKPAPALVFLHGSGGNFKAYTWLLSQVADELGMVLIAPSCGMGNWDAKLGPRAVTAALDDAAKTILLDSGNIHLMGLSNGGLGVSRMAAGIDGGRFSSLVFLSAVCDQAALGSLSFAATWKDKPVLVLTGRDDDRVPLAYEQNCADMMECAGVLVDMSIFDAADHFLFFSHRGEVIANLSAWLAARMDGNKLKPL